MEVIRDGAAQGIRSAVIHSAGFGETSESGKAREKEVLEIARSSGMVLCGPNSAGLVNIPEKVALTPVVSMELDGLIHERIGFVSQSGGMMGSLMTRAHARGMGFSYLVSTGNEVDLQATDYIEFMLDDPLTDVVIVFLEGFRDIERFFEIADLSLRKEKPLLVLKVGRSETGAKAAKSHTGSMAGSDEVYSAIFKQKGIVRVSALEDLIETASLFCKYKPHSGNRVGVLTTTGGVAMLIADECSACGFEFPKPCGRTLETVAKGLPTFASFSNPLDVTMSGVGIGFGKAIDLFLQDPNFDIVMAVVGTSSQFAPEMGVKPIVERDRGSKKTLVSFLNPNAEEALRLLERNGIPTFRTPESSARVLKHFRDYSRFLERQRRAPDPIETRGMPLDPSVFSEARRILDSSGSVLNEVESKRLLRLLDVPVTEEQSVFSLEDALKAAKEIGYPVAVKVISSDIPHKTEAGVIQLSIRNEEELEQAFRTVMVRGKEYKPDFRFEGILIQEMIGSGTETILGMHQDPQFGPVILFGMGGVLVELIKDVSLRVAPLRRTDAVEMIQEVKTSAALKGFRGRAETDVEALIETILKVSKLSMALKDTVKEIDINPLVVLEKGRGVKAVDALVIKKPPF
jgi:acetyltransferase